MSRVLSRGTSWVLSLVLMTGTLAFVRGSGVAATDSETRILVSKTNRMTSLICSVSAFFSVDPGERLDDSYLINGRGLANCKNDQGFSSEFPVLLNLVADLEDPLLSSGEFSFSGNTEPFVVSREISQMQDNYTVRSFSWLTSHQDSQSMNQKTLFRGDRHDLVIAMELSSKTSPLVELKIKSLSVQFDHQAPDLKEAE